MKNTKIFSLERVKGTVVDSCQENDAETLEARRPANEGKVFVNGCRQLITLHERNFQSFRHSRQPRSPRANLSASFMDLSATPFHPSPRVSLIFLSPVRVYEYLIRQTGRTYSVNEAPRCDLDKKNKDTCSNMSKDICRSSFRNVQRVTLCVTFGLDCY